MNDVSVTDLLAQLHQTFLDDLPARIDKSESEVMSSRVEDAYEELFRVVHR